MSCIYSAPKNSLAQKPLRCNPPVQHSADFGLNSSKVMTISWEEFVGFNMPKSSENEGKQVILSSIDREADVLDERLPQQLSFFAQYRARLMCLNIDLSCNGRDFFSSPCLGFRPWERESINV